MMVLWTFLNEAHVSSSLERDELRHVVDGGCAACPAAVELCQVVF